MKIHLYIVLVLLSFTFSSCFDLNEKQIISRIKQYTNQNISLDSILIYKNKYGENVLFTAVEKNDYEMVEFLLEKNINVNDTTSTGLTALMLAKELEIIKLLVENGADINAKDNQGWTALTYFLSNNTLEQLEYLFSKGGNINTKTNAGYNLLYYAILNGSLETIEFLIKKNIQFNLNSFEIQNALYIARERDYSHILEYFKLHYNYQVNNYNYNNYNYNNNHKVNALKSIKMAFYT